MVPLILLLGICAAVALYVRSPSFKGRVGEARVARQLRSGLDTEEYKVFSDLMLTDGRGTTQIDHVVLSRYGIFVIETKNMTGWIFGSPSQASWTQVLYGHKTRFQNPLRQNYRHIKALQHVLGVDERHMTNLVVFTGSARPKMAMPVNVIWHARSLSSFITMKQDKLFSDEDVERFAARLSHDSHRATLASRRAHVRLLKAKGGA